MLVSQQVSGEHTCWVPGLALQGAGCESMSPTSGRFFMRWLVAIIIPSHVYGYVCVCRCLVLWECG